MRKKITGFSVLMLLTFMAHGMINTQAVPFLTNIGYNSIERGYIMSFYALVAVVGQFVTGYLCDKYKTVKRFFIYTSIMLIGFTFLTFILDDHQFMIHLVLMGNTIGFIRIIGNLLETWLIEVDDMYPYFGSIRSLGSLGWAIASLLSGYLIIYKGYLLLMWVSIFINILVVIVSFMMEEATKATDISIHISDVKMLFQNNSFLLLILVYGFTYIVYNADHVAVSDYIFYIGGSEKDIGIKWFVQALSEIPLLFAGTYLLGRFKGKKLMMFGSFFLGVRYVLYALVPSTIAVIIVSTLQAFSFPFVLVSQKELVLNETPPALRSTGQMVSVAMTSGLSAILSPIISGYLADVFSIRHVVFGFGALMLVPILMMALYQPSRIT